MSSNDDRWMGIDIDTAVVWVPRVVYVIVGLIIACGFMALAGCSPHQASIKPQGWVRSVHVDETPDFINIHVVQPRKVAGKAALVTTPSGLCSAFLGYGRANVVESKCANVQCDTMYITFSCNPYSGQ